MNERNFLKLFIKAENQTVLYDQLQSVTGIPEWEADSLLNSAHHNHFISCTKSTTDRDGFRTPISYAITGFGKERYLELLRLERSHRFNEIRARITLGIALLSLLVAVISIILAVLTYLQG